ncbi:hypothetical protein [Methylobrevis albus]|nr:hypothetical protein [Methylobrevis albus]
MIRARRLGALCLAIAAAASTVGAASYEWSFAPKGDRVVSAADCRGAFIDAVACEGTELPVYATGLAEVAPGVSAVVRIAN